MPKHTPDGGRKWALKKQAALLEDHLYQAGAPALGDSVGAVWFDLRASGAGRSHRGRQDKGGCLPTLLSVSDTLLRWRVSGESDRWRHADAPLAVLSCLAWADEVAKGHFGGCLGTLRGVGLGGQAGLP